MDETLSLSGLQDIVLPGIPALWPPAPGFWILLFLLLITVISLWRWRRVLYRRNAYRRAGLELLADAQTVYEVSVTLKRVALAAFPREEVASLHDTEWANFLNNSCSHCHFDAETWRENTQTADRTLHEKASVWIRKHVRPVSGKAPDE